MPRETIKRVRLGELISLAPVVKCGARNLPVLSMTMHDGLMLQSDRFKKKIASLDLSGYKVVIHNQLVVSFPIDEGVLSVQDVVDEGIVSPAYAVWNVNADIVLPKFLEIFLRCPISIDFYKSKLRGSTARRRTIPKEAFLSMLMPAYPLSEQKRIAAALDKICEMKRNIESRLQKLDLLIKSRFSEMFGAIRNVVPLSAMGKISTGSTPSMKVPEYYDESDYCFVKPSDLSYDIVTILDSESHISRKAESVARMYNPGAVLVTCIGATIGKMGISKVRGTCNQQINIVEPNEIVDSVYLAYALQSRKPALVAAANSTAVPILNKSEFSKFMIPLPPLPLQREFAAFVEKVEGMKAVAKKELEKVDLLYRAKLQEYFG